MDDKGIGEGAINTKFPVDIISKDTR